MFGENIKKLRISKGLTQKELADALNFTFQNISKWENDISMPDIPTAMAIAAFFGVSMDTLLGNKPKTETLSFAVSVNEKGELAVWTDEPFQNTQAPVFEPIPERRRAGEESKKGILYVGVNAEGKICTIVSYSKAFGGDVGVVANRRFYHRLSERNSVLRKDPSANRYDILVPKGGFLFSLNAEDHRVKTLFRTIIPARYHAHFDGTSLLYNAYTSINGVHLFHAIGSGELDEVAVTLDENGIHFTKPAEFIDPLYDNIDHLTRLVKERVELSLQEMKTEIGYLHAKIEELISRVEDTEAMADEAYGQYEELESRIDELENGEED